MSGGSLVAIGILLLSLSWIIMEALKLALHDKLKAMSYVELTHYKPNRREILITLASMAAKWLGLGFIVAGAIAWLWGS